MNSVVKGKLPEFDDSIIVGNGLGQVTLDEVLELSSDYRDVGNDQYDNRPVIYFTNGDGVTEHYRIIHNGHDYTGWAWKSLPVDRAVQLVSTEKAFGRNNLGLGTVATRDVATVVQPDTSQYPDRGKAVPENNAVVTYVTGLVTPIQQDLATVQQWAKDTTTLIPSAKLPSFVDDVIDFIPAYKYLDDLYRPLVNGKLDPEYDPASPSFPQTIINGSQNVGKLYVVPDTHTGDPDWSTVTYYTWNADNSIWVEVIQFEEGKIYVNEDTSKSYRTNSARTSLFELIASPGTLDDIIDGQVYGKTTLTQISNLNEVYATYIKRPVEGTHDFDDRIAIYDGNDGVALKKGPVLPANPIFTDQYVTAPAYHYLPEYNDSTTADPHIMANIDNNNVMSPINTYSSVGPSGTNPDGSTQPGVPVLVSHIYIDSKGHFLGWDSKRPMASDILYAETDANKVTSWSQTPNNLHYPSEKLVMDTFKIMAWK